MSSEKKTDASFRDRAFSLLQLGLPTRFLSWCMFRLTRIRQPGFKNWFIRVFMGAFKISLEEAAIQNVNDFRDFNEFFTRQLKKHVRPLAPAPAFLCPVDGTISQVGKIDSGRLFQAKGHHYTAVELLGGGMENASQFLGGHFATIYLAPYNYHRIHMPLAGTLKWWRYVPGRLFSVNPATARSMPGLFARNERVIAAWETDRGPLAMVLVGALFVGSIETVWAGQITPPHRRHDDSGNYTPMSPISLERGDEMGRFNMGSTVILLTGPGMVDWVAAAAPGAVVHVGQELAP